MAEDLKIIEDRQQELSSASKWYEKQLLETRNVLDAAMCSGGLKGKSAQALLAAVDGALVQEGIYPPKSEISEARLFGEDV